MIITSEQVQCITISLTEEEARWLKDYMQKPNSEAIMSPESQQDYDLRCLLFTQLRKVLAP